MSPDFAQLMTVGILVASPFVGSFIGTLADRLPLSRHVIWDRSKCDHCDHQLGPRDLVPLFSWLLSGAKCRYCRGSISIYYPLVEIAALVAASAFLALDGPLAWVTVLLGWLLLALAAMDLRHMILADSLNLALLLSGLIVAVAWSRFSFADHIVGVLVGAGMLFCVNRFYRFLRQRDGLGLGDIKLAAGAGAWVSWQGLGTVLLWATLVALMLVLGGALGRELKQDTAIPFGAFLCLGIWMTWVLGPLSWS